MLKVYNKLFKLIEAVMVVLLSWSVIVIAAQIFWRYVLRAPLGWTEQAARAGFIWMVMLGIPVMFNRDIWMSFDIILEKIPGKANLVIHAFLLVCGLAFSVFYFFASLKLCLLTGNRQVSGFPLPMNALYSAQPAGALLLILVFVRKFIGLVATSKPQTAGKKQGA
jgi:TRAP-type C4-dicarboxylate transport system permease small subunit